MTATIGTPDGTYTSEMDYLVNRTFDVNSDMIEASSGEAAVPMYKKPGQIKVRPQDPNKPIDEINLELNPGQNLGTPVALLNKPNLSDYVPPKDFKRAPIEQKYEDMPTSTNVEDRRMNKSDWVNQISKEYTGFSKEQWGQVWDAITKRPLEPMEKPMGRYIDLLPLKTNDPLAKAAGYEDLPVPIAKNDAPYEPFWSPLRVMDEEQMKSGGKVLRPDFGAPGPAKGSEPSTTGKVISPTELITRRNAKGIERLEKMSPEEYWNEVKYLYKDLPKDRIDAVKNQVIREREYAGKIRRGELTEEGMIKPDPYQDAVTSQQWKRFVDEGRLDRVLKSYKETEPGVYKLQKKDIEELVIKGLQEINQYKLKAGVPLDPVDITPIK